MLRVLQRVWALPLTLVGVVPALLVWAAGGRLRCRAGAIEVYGPLANRMLRWPCVNFVAVTIGHIIIARDEQCCRIAGAHERVHVRQGELWGPLFPFAYCGAGLWQVLNGKRFYSDNPFEVEARRAGETDGSKLQNLPTRNAARGGHQAL